MTSPSKYAATVAAEALNRCCRCVLGQHEVCKFEGRYCECSCVPVQLEQMAKNGAAQRRLATADLPARWCVKHLTGWCLIVGDVEPDEGTANVPTGCGLYVALPGGYEHRFPTCAECIDSILPDASSAGQVR